MRFAAFLARVCLAALFCGMIFGSSALLWEMSFATRVPILAVIYGIIGVFLMYVALAGLPYYVYRTYRRIVLQEPA